MLDVVLATRDVLRPAVEGSVTGATPKLYVGTRPATVSIPHALIRASGGSVFRKRTEEYIETVYLDLYARSPGEAQLMENAVVFMDDYRPANYGNAIAIHYLLESRTSLSESETVEHVTLLYAAHYTDKRKVVMR